MPVKYTYTSRWAAIDILCRWQKSKRPVDQIMVSPLYILPDTDRQLCKTLVHGVLRQREYLDFIIEGFSKHPLKKMKPLTLTALRVGVFQLLLLDRIPESAAVNETVKALKAARQPKWLISFANGLLRNIARQKASLPKSGKAVRNGRPILNHPQWLIQRWQQQFGAEKTAEICRVNNRQPTITLRTTSRQINSSAFLQKLEQAGCQAEAGHFSPNAIIVHSMPGSLTDLPGFSDGFFQVQDEAAQLASLLLGPFKAGENYLDGCAGLGGKTCHIAELLPEDTSLIAVEPDGRRFRLLGENLSRLKSADKVQTFHGNLDEFQATSPGAFDAILIDAPCSGTGVIRRHPDIRWNRKPEDLPDYHQQQLKLLTTAAAMLKTAGILVYATCSLEPEENEQVIKSFLKSYPEFSISNSRDFLPEQATCLVDRSGFFHPTPADGLDGFFAARLVRSPSL
ncbi:MAG: 16S rRNA (cytosine(967)-C(5))-methyltransferase RsmB [Desulfobulbaceae bacterium]|nr:16S rRNA (cytosine(967)-C(5))-methyltransferase RsmB [Desulfobulbaceae bacterium]